MDRKPTYEEIEQKAKEFEKETLKKRCSTIIPPYQNIRVNLGLFYFLVFAFPALLWSVERCIENSCHKICPLPIFIVVLVVAFVLLRRHLSHFIRVPLLTGVVLALVLVGNLTQTATDGSESERIVVAVGDSFEPWMYINTDGEPDGMYVDRWRLWSEKTGVDVHLRPMVWANTIPALIAGKVDAVDGVSYTPERGKFLELSESYTEIPSYIYFHKSIGGVRGLDDLEGFPIGVLGGSIVENYLRTQAPKLRPVPYANYEEVAKAAIQDRLRVFVGEDPMIPFLFAKMGHQITFRRTEDPIISGDMRTAVRKGETELLALIERGQTAITSAEWQKIRDKWAGVSLTSQIPWRWLIGGVAILFSGIALLLLWNTQLQKQVATATKTLSESEERLRSFGNALPDLAFIIDEDGRYIEILTAEENLLFMDLSDIRNHLMHEVLPKNIADLSLEMIERTIATGKIQVFEYKLDLPAGQRWFEARLSPMHRPPRDKRMVTCISRDISERKQMEETLKVSESRYRSLFENTGTATFVVEEDMTISQINAKCEELFRYSKDEIEGKVKTLDFLREEDLERIKKYHFGRREEDGAYPSEYELKLVDKLGDTRNAIIQVGMISGTKKAINSIIDITPLRRAEKDLRQSEERFRSMVANIPGGVYRCDNDSDWTMRFLSDAIADVSGYPASDFIDNRVRTYASVIHPDDRAMVEKAVEKNIEAGEPFTVEYRIHNAEGKLRWVFGRGLGVLGEDGEVEYLDGAIFDITERKLADEALQETEKKLESIINHHYQLTGMLDAQGRLLVANKTALEYLSAAESDVIGKLFWETPWWSHSKEEQNRLQNAIQTAGQGEFVRFETSHFNSKGELRIIDFSINPIIDDGGNVKYLIPEGRDITGLKEAEESLRKSESQLRNLANRLQEAEEMARKDLARELHDQVGQSLTALNINLNILRNQLPPDALKQLEERLDDSMDLLEETTKTIRNVMAELRPSVLDDYGLTAALRWYGKQFSDRTGISVQLKVDEMSSRLAEMVESALFRISQEALTNVAKHADASKLIVTMDESDGLLKLIIADNGKGFDIASINKAEVRTGWGILNMQERIQALGGQLLIESEPGKGTNVIIEIRK